MHYYVHMQYMQCHNPNNHTVDYSMKLGVENNNLAPEFCFP